MSPLDVMPRYGAAPADGDDASDGNGTPDSAQARTYNRVNEITAITGGSWATPAHDRAGNMTTIPSPRPQGGRGAGGEGTSLACTYDAWNRLVEVKDGTVTVGRYEYDGLNRRIVRRYDSRSPGSPQGIDRHEHCYYNSAWQLLETRETTSSTALPQDVQPKHQYVWSLTYIDTPVLRDENTDSDGLCDDGRCYYLHDANMNVVALTSTAGAVVERYAYDAYGKTTIYDGAWSATRSVSSYSNAITYTGRQYDPETGFLYFRQRYLTAPLGRFLSRDPIFYRGGDMSLCRYVGNRPLTALDWQGTRFIVAGPHQGLNLSIADFFDGGPSNTWYFGKDHDVSLRFWTSHFALQWVREHYERDIEGYCHAFPEGERDWVAEGLQHTATFAEFIDDLKSLWGFHRDGKGLDFGVQVVGSFTYSVYMGISCPKCEKWVQLFVLNTWSIASLTRIPGMRSSVTSSPVLNPVDIVVRYYRRDKVRNQ